jgi:hypothetical protein
MRGIAGGDEAEIGSVRHCGDSVHEKDPRAGSHDVYRAVRDVRAASYGQIRDAQAQVGRRLKIDLPRRYVKERRGNAAEGHRNIAKRHRQRSTGGTGRR